MSTPLVAVSLKMYFERERTLGYCRAVADIARERPAVAEGTVRLAVLPDFLTTAAAADIFTGTEVFLGAQDLAPEARGAFTGEVSGADLAALGVRCVEVGHAERRTIFKEDDQMVARKTATALSTGLIPLLCVGEADKTDPEEAAAICAEQVASAVGGRTDEEIWVAYEPYWAIGAPEPAPAEYVIAVCEALRTRLADSAPSYSLLYGGSAGPGLLTRLGNAVDGLFLGRFAHDPAAFGRVVDEAIAR